jgi:hypothetical protein
LFGAMLDWRLWPCRVLHWGLFRQGVHVHVGRGSYFFRTRDDAQLIDELEQRRPEREAEDAESEVAEVGG